MARIVAIVEGHGEVTAVPILIRRIGEALLAPAVPDVPKPIRTRRQGLLKEGEIERAVELAARQSAPGDGILILIDADEDCPKDLAAEVLVRARATRGDRRIRVVLAKAEFETWFMAASESIAGQRGIDPALTSPIDPESIRDAKGWLTRRMVAGRSYRETLDQPALCAVFDLAMARSRSASFDKLWRDVVSLLTPED